MLTYDTKPTYPLVGESAIAGYDELVACAEGLQTLVIEGPATPRWDEIITELRAAFARAGRRAEVVDHRAWFLSWSELLEATSSSVIPGDPYLARLFEGSLDSLLSTEGFEFASTNDVDIQVLVGPAASTHAADECWYLDVPRRFALAEVGTAGAVLGRIDDQEPDFRRMVFNDWPVVEGTRRALRDRIDRFVDATVPSSPTSIDGATMRASVADLVQRPFRTAPHFLPGIWGGQWMKGRWNLEGDPNLAWSYEIIAPEAGVAFAGHATPNEDRDGPTVELPLDLVIDIAPVEVLGDEVHERYGYSFPIRFDYLDTYDGSPLSIHCHPNEDYMREVFGWPYTQHESYYVTDTKPGSEIYLGLREDADFEALQADCIAADEEGIEFDPGRHINRFESERHGLYLIPSGTPHASGEGNLVLEISSTPYFYSLRLYDWLRTDDQGQQRAVHVAHAFENVKPERRGEAVEALHCKPEELRRTANGAVEYRLADTDVVPFAVNRLEFFDYIEDNTEGRFLILNLVEGGAVSIEADGVSHRLNYGETIVIPAATGAYCARLLEGGPAKLVKAFVR